MHTGPENDFAFIIIGTIRNFTSAEIMNSVDECIRKFV